MRCAFPKGKTQTISSSQTLNKQTIFNFLSEITDPEIPVLNIVEMGIVRNVVLENEKVRVVITPTYSGCPAMKMIENEISEKLKVNGFSEVELQTIYSPVWTTDWLTEEAKKNCNYSEFLHQSKFQEINLCKLHYRIKFLVRTAIHKKQC